ncbi:MAG: lysozyme [Novosphingobium sp.]|nr:lysozyme [Novosphingobium sp.]
MPDEVQRPAPLQPMEAPKTGKGKLIATAGAVGAAALLGLLQPWEGKSNHPYKDIVGVWTVCYGETRVEMKRYSDAECEDMLADASDGFAKGVLAATPRLKGHPYQLAAATSLAYNIGLRAYAGSTADKRFDAGDFRGGCAAITSWNRAGGKVRKGLQNRRAAEYRVCMTGL